MSILEREQWSRKIMEVASDFAIAWVEAEEIDQLGMSRAGKLVFEQAIAGLKSQPGYLLLDYFKLPQVSTPKPAWSKVTNVAFRSPALRFSPNRPVIRK